MTEERLLTTSYNTSGKSPEVFCALNVSKPLRRAHHENGKTYISLRRSFPVQQPNGFRVLRLEWDSLDIQPCQILLFQAVERAFPVFLWQYKPQHRIQIRSDFLSPVLFTLLSISYTTRKRSPTRTERTSNQAFRSLRLRSCLRSFCSFSNRPTRAPNGALPLFSGGGGYCMSSMGSRMSSIGSPGSEEGGCCD